MSGMLTKDTTRLRCPKCGGEVDAGHTWTAVKRIWKDGLRCEHCGVPLRKVSKNYWWPLPLIGLELLAFWGKWGEPYDSVLGFLGLAGSIGLIALQTASTKLEVRDESDQR